MELSIIIPVHNAEKFLTRCLNSVIFALEFAGLAEISEAGEITAAKAEILLIENDSTDRSRDLCLQYAEKYPLAVKAFECQGGASRARNLGARTATGNYIWFIDADDAIEMNAVLDLMTVAKNTDADLVMMGMKRIYSATHSDYLSAVIPSDPNFRSRFVRYGAGPCQFLIKREWWLKNNFTFREGIIHEDMELISSLILYTNKFAGVDEPLYLYYQNPNSVLHQKTFNPHIFDIFPALEGLYERFRAAGAEKEFHDELEWFFIWNLLIDSAKDFGQFPEGKPGYARARKMLKKYFPQWRKNKFYKKKSLKFRMKCLLNYSII